MDQPLVSVLCLCYNHARFVREAIDSVLAQKYSNIEIIIVDDASTDASKFEIEALIKMHPSIRFIANKSNVGICKAFNIAFAISKGEYVVDFATDDVLHPDRISEQVNLFSTLDDSYGVVFTDAIYINESGDPIREHTEYLLKKRLINRIPEGDVYSDLLQTYFIASPTMLVRRAVLEQLHGYDESLSYEDFDFWVRSSRVFRYKYLPEKLTHVRRSPNSLSRGWYTPGDPQLHSTYMVCLKAKELNRNEAEAKALINRVRYELRQSVFSDNRSEAVLFYKLLLTLENPTLSYHFLYFLNTLKFPLSGLRRIYHKLRYD